MKSLISGLTAIVILLSPCCQSAEPQRDRPPAVAGFFYPADATELASLVDRDMASAQVPKIGGRIIGLIAPHAGYKFSGGVAAHSYAVVRGKKFKRVVLIGPTHVEPVAYTSVHDGDSYSTPLGKVPVDREFARRLANADRSLRLSSLGHTVRTQSEHSIEVQLPFLQRALGEFQIVPVIMGDQSYESSRALGMALAKLLRRDEETLLVASSDLAHYHTYDNTVRKDWALLKGITQNDFLSVSRNLEADAWEACGGGPIISVMIAAQHLGASSPRLLKYANSGDVTGDKGRVVGYAALVLAEERDEEKSQDFGISDKEKGELLKIARLSVESMVRGNKVYQPPTPANDNLLQERGAFVTLRKRGELRGCIGYTSATYSLYTTIRDAAALAALRDPRFPPVKPEELKDLDYELSLLSPMQHVVKTESIRVGQHGLLIRRGRKEGLLLPQVAVEERWDRVTFLEQVALKAGLPIDSWRDDDTDLFTFTAVVFSDRSVTAGKH